MIAVIGTAGDDHVRGAIVELLRGRRIDPAEGSTSEVLDGTGEIDAVILCLEPSEVPAAVSAATACGVGRIVLMSSAAAPFERGVPTDQQWFLPAEHAVEGSGVEWTIVRPVGLMTAALSWADDVRTTHTVRHPFGTTAYPHVHETDVAAVAVAAAIGPGHHGSRYTVTGPAAITPVEQTATLAAALGQHLTFDELSPVAAAQRWAIAGWSPEDIELELMLLADFADRPPRARDTVARVVGRPARSFSEWALDHTGDFRT